MIVKICGITNEADALLSVALGADAVGFVFAPSPRQVSKAVVGEIVHRLPPEVLTVGVFRNESPKRVVEIVNSLGLRAAQLHGEESVTDSLWVAERIPLLIKAFPAGHPMVSRFEEYGARWVLVDSASPGSGRVFDWSLAEGVTDHSKLLVSGGLNYSNVGGIIELLHPLGVDVSSSVEAEPGRKDPMRLRAFINAARTAQAAVESSNKDESTDSTDGAELYDWQDEEL
ncbi:MAG: phosphoribosylanthranilate isomerase [Actinobacteria bacterium]|jgi:phosphoribosylanthranilate isomerase|nr:phosphoribosylanthranilate isomerase [Actinomycetota bacterium]MCL6095517.1 phosphoribosylanthranilate isomerase [Actinomycetota bacterium]